MINARTSCYGGCESWKAATQPEDIPGRHLRWASRKRKGRAGRRQNQRGDCGERPGHRTGRESKRERQHPVTVVGSHCSSTPAARASDELTSPSSPGRGCQRQPLNRYRGESTSQEGKDKSTAGDGSMQRLCLPLPALLEGRTHAGLDPSPLQQEGWSAPGLIPPHQEGRDSMSKISISLSSMQLYLTL